MVTCIYTYSPFINKHPNGTLLIYLIRRVYDSSARLDRKAGILDDRPAKLKKQFSIIIHKRFVKLKTSSLNSLILFEFIIIE